MKTIEIRAIKFLFDIVLLMFLLINNYLLSDKKLFPQTVILHYILDLHTITHSKSTISKYYSIWLQITLVYLPKSTGEGSTKPFISAFFIFIRILKVDEVALFRVVAAEGTQDGKGGLQCLKSSARVQLLVKHADVLPDGLVFPHEDIKDRKSTRLNSSH